MDAVGLDRPEGSPGSISIKLSADPVALMLGAPVKELIEPLWRLSDREDAGSLLLLRHGAIPAAERHFVSETVERGP
jgi:hypothetical protein